MWKVPLLNQCCCGCSLKKGCVIIGALGIIQGLATIIETACGCGWRLTTYKFSTGSVTEWKLVPVTEYILGFVLVFLGVALIVGSVKEVPRVVLGWVLARAVISLLTLVLLPVSLGFRFTYKNRLILAPLIFIGGVAELAVDIYFLLVGYSFYRTIAGNEPPPFYF